MPYLPDFRAFAESVLGWRFFPAGLRGHLREPYTDRAGGAARRLRRDASPRFCGARARAKRRRLSMALSSAGKEPSSRQFMRLMGLCRGPPHHPGRHTPSMFPVLRYSVFGSFYRPSPDDLPSRLRLKYCWLLCERIDAAPLLCSGLLNDNEFGKSGHKEASRFLEFFVAYFRERLDDALDVLPRHIVRMLLSDFLNELGLRHQLGHVSSLLPNRPVTT